MVQFFSDHLFLSVISKCRWRQPVYRKIFWFSVLFPYKLHDCDYLTNFHRQQFSKHFTTIRGSSSFQALINNCIVMRCWSVFKSMRCLCLYLLPFCLPPSFPPSLPSFLPSFLSPFFSFFSFLPPSLPTFFPFLSFFLSFFLFSFLLSFFHL